MYKLANKLLKTLPSFSVARSCNSVIKRHNTPLTNTNHFRTTFVNYRNYGYLFAGVAVVTYVAYESKASGEEIAADTAAVISSVTESTDTNKTTLPEKWTLYQYTTCPFCCKVRAYLDYYGYDYNIVEVNPLSKNEVKFSKYRKVPFVTSENHQINDSSVVISLLRSNNLGKGDIGTLINYYPFMDGENGAKGDYQNKYNIMYQQEGTDEQTRAVREEAKWRRWVDDVFVHTLSPNIYRTMGEALQAMEYFYKVGNFSEWERNAVYYVGASVMYMIGKRLKKKYHLRNDVRESLYEEARKWTSTVGTDRPFMGGKQPNLADLNMYGVISAIEDLSAFDDLMNNTKIQPWYTRMKKQVQSHRGTKDPDWLTLVQ